MKKRTKIITTLIILILIITGAIYTLFLNNSKNEEIADYLKGEKIGNGIFGYTLTETANINDYLLLNDYIYYLEYNNQVEDSFAYYKYNIHTLEKTLINDYLEYFSCTFEENNVVCSKNNTYDVYDLNLEKLYSVTIEDDKSLILLNDTYFLVDENVIYDKNGSTIWTLDAEYNNYYYIDYYLNDNNLYLVLVSDTIENYLIYDYTNNLYTKIDASILSKYINGYYNLTDNSIQILNLKNNTNNTYDFPLNRKISQMKTLNELDNTLYVYNDEIKSIEAINFIENTYNTINVDLDLDYVLDCDYYNNYLYIRLLNSKYNFYVIDLNNALNNEISIDEYNAEKENELLEKIDNIKNKYNVNVHIKEDALIEIPSYTILSFSDVSTISDKLDTIVSILDKFDKDFFDSFYNDDYDGLNIYLTGVITSSVHGADSTRISGLTSLYDNKYVMLLNLEDNELEGTVCHEMMHAIEKVLLSSQEYFIATDWLDLNPKNYSYSYSYSAQDRFEYTLNLSADDIYFMNSYSHSFPSEDMAEIFGAVCSVSANSEVNDYPHLYAKAEFLKNTILKYYPTLANGTLFNSLS